MDGGVLEGEGDADGGWLQVGLAAREWEKESYVTASISDGMLIERDIAILKMSGGASWNVGDTGYIFREFCVDSDGAIGSGIIGRGPGTAGRGWWSGNWTHLGLERWIHGRAAVSVRAIDGGRARNE